MIRGLHAMFYSVLDYFHFAILHTRERVTLLRLNPEGMAARSHG
jgi:hypothetical protein